MWNLPLILKLFRRTAGINRKRMVMTVAAIAWGTLSIVLLLSLHPAGLTTDQRGFTLKDGDGNGSKTVDIGAFER